MTFLTKRDYSVATETLNLVHRLCANQEVTNMLLKDHHFHYLVELSSTSPSEDVRSLCFKIFGSLALSPSKQVVKMLFHKTRLVRVIADRLSKETSEDVISSILLFLMKITVRNYPIIIFFSRLMRFILSFLLQQAMMTITSRKLLPA
ncbi:hypothetical protein FGO68_gene13917 [Halteria grandinella]|uniref:Uncharacterized protein n=1 Tax=Halteria grandinella TaxID=5974 RepID=A0A8J8NFF6_HALGN|nr:hypothetical protein FGO68_gene13917 [Halteria grandinella]